MYRDVWDNKPPVIHLLSALAWSVSPHVEAAYEMERLALLLCAALLFATLRYALGFRSVPALCGLVVGLVALRNPEVFNGGYSTEEYGILFEVAAIACLALALRNGSVRAIRVSQCAFGLFAALTILTRQTFVAALASALGVIWLAAHAPLVRSPRRLLRAIGWEVAGFALPTVLWVVYLWRTDSFTPVFELLPETFVFGSTPFLWNVTPNARLGVGVQYWSPAAFSNTLRASAIRGIAWFIAIVFHGDRRVAIALAIVGTIAVLMATAARKRGRTVMSITPLVLPLWFAAELAVASAPGNYFGPYYIPFVPFLACLISVIAEVLIPPERVVRTCQQRGALQHCWCVSPLLCRLSTHGTESIRRGTGGSLRRMRACRYRSWPATTRSARLGTSTLRSSLYELSRGSAGHGAQTRHAVSCPIPLPVRWCRVATRT